MDNGFRSSIFSPSDLAMGRLMNQYQRQTFQFNSSFWSIWLLSRALTCARRDDVALHADGQPLWYSSPRHCHCCCRYCCCCHRPSCPRRGLPGSRDEDFGGNGGAAHGRPPDPPLRCKSKGIYHSSWMQVVHILWMRVAHLMNTCCRYNMIVCCTYLMNTCCTHIKNAGVHIIFSLFWSYQAFLLYS